MFFRLSAFALLALAHAAGASHQSHSMGLTQMRIESRSESPKQSIIDEIIKVTESFLNENFQESYGFDYQTSHMGVVSFTCDPVSADDGQEESTPGQVAKLTVTGTAYFANNTLLAQTEVADMVAEYFEMYNPDFLRGLLHSSDPFLQATHYATVKVDTEQTPSFDDSSPDEDPSAATSPEAAIVVGSAGGVGMGILILVGILWYCLQRDEGLFTSNHSLWTACLSWYCFSDKSSNDSSDGRDNKGGIWSSNNSWNPTKTQRVRRSRRQAIEDGYESDEDNIIHFHRDHSPPPVRETLSRDHFYRDHLDSPYVPGKLA